MSTWLVILMLGKSVGVVGPLPMTRDACLDRADDRSQFASEIKQTGYALFDVTLDCVRSSRKPPLGEER